MPPHIQLPAPLLALDPCLKMVSPAPFLFPLLFLPSPSPRLSLLVPVSFSHRGVWFSFRVPYTLPVLSWVCSLRWFCGAGLLPFTFVGTSSAGHDRSTIAALLPTRGLHQAGRTGRFCADARASCPLPVTADEPRYLATENEGVPTYCP